MSVYLELPQEHKDISIRTADINDKQRLYFKFFPRDTLLTVYGGCYGLMIAKSMDYFLL